MWLWIVSALIIVLAWVAWWFVGLPLGLGAGSWWMPAAVTGAVVLFVVGILVFRRIRAARAARALEKAIAQQAQEQALAAKPERVAEIQELHKQIQQGINALKASKLGGGKSGADALYVLPWYVMVGPPGAGKTTALRHSGLVFPYLDPAGGGVRGVGGTRNCDWWFTNEAILLDTAGRYTTEADDHDEWMAFLEQLLKYRTEKPINGVIVAVSVSELLDATDDQIQSTAAKIRARIDEMQTTLKEVIPVYVMFTKIDLVAGFAEFFGGLKKSERSQPWGSTIRLDTDKSEPGKLFDTEFDVLVEKLHTMGLRRMALERNRETKEKIYQFPLEFAAIKRSLSDFLQAAFAKGTTTPPILRGFYFTSGLQEGKPLDRVVGAMGRAFGLRGAAESETPAEKLESKSFFLRDVFMNIIFPDQGLAARTEAELVRLRRQRYAAVAVAAVFALLFMIPSIISFVNNRRLVAKTDTISKSASAIQWDGGGTPTDKVTKLDELRAHVEDLYQNKVKGPPIGMGFPMYQGDKLYPPARDQYVDILRKGFIRPAKDALEDKLKNAKGENYLDDYNNLKTYLLLNDRVHLVDHAEWEKGRLIQLWAENLRKTSNDGSESDLKQKLAQHVSFYVDLLKNGEVPGEALDKPLIENVRDKLTRVGSAERYYNQFVTVLIDQKYDETGPNSPENLKYPPVTLQSIFADRPEVLAKVRSSRHEGSEKKWGEVQGPYTFKGHEQVLANLEEGHKLLEREKWVVPLTAEEEKEGDRIQKNLDRVRQDYDAQYIAQWVNFFRDIDVAIPANNREAIGEFKVLSTPDWPYQRLLRTLADNTQFDEVYERGEAEAQLLADGGLADQLRQRIQRRVDSRIRMNSAKLLGGSGQKAYVDPVPEKFRSMVRFGVPAPAPKPKEGEPPKEPGPVEMGTYVGKLQDLAGEMGNIEDGPVNADTKKATEKFEDAVKTTQGELLKMDETGQELMTPLLMNPLKQAYKAVIRHAGGAASGLWEVMVWPAYRDKIKDRYPFNLASTKDASFADAVAFFKPKGGTLWGFYDKYLKPFHSKVNHDFIPDPHLESRPRPAKPFTPFRPLMYPCLHRADEITRALFPDSDPGANDFGGGPPAGAKGGEDEGADKPHVEFQVNLKNVSPIVSEVILEIDGQKRVYRNEKEFWNPMAWPGKKQTGARIQVRGAGGLDEEIVREGPWGIFRLFEAGTTTAEKDKDDVFLVTWQMTAPPVSVTMEVRPTRSAHPFSPSFFRATNCPPSIGDSFGGGKGGGKG
jgi:type VI secretion system protein ImpL